MNKREQQLYQEYLANLKLRLKDRNLLHTPDGDVGPFKLERGFTSAVSREDFRGWVLGFYNLNGQSEPAPFRGGRVPFG